MLARGYPAQSNRKAARSERKNTASSGNISLKSCEIARFSAENISSGFIESLLLLSGQVSLNHQIPAHL